MNQNKEQRMELLLSGGSMIGESGMNVNQAINKQRKNVDPLIKFLISYRYYEQRPTALDVLPLPNEFEDFSHYQASFQVKIIIIQSLSIEI